MGDQPAEPEPRENLLKNKIHEVWQRATEAKQTVQPDAANPLSSVGTSIAGGAWESPDADDFVTDVSGVATAIAANFQGAVDDLWSAYAAEPENVMVPGPQQWKADAGSVAMIGAY